MQRSEYKSRVEGWTAKIDESMEKYPMHLSGGSRVAPRCRQRSIRIQGNAEIQVPTILSKKTSCF